MLKLINENICKVLDIHPANILVIKAVEEAGVLPPKSEPTYHRSGKQLMSENKWDEE